MSIYKLSDHTSDTMTRPAWDDILGLQAVFTTAGGEKKVGTIEAPIRASSGYPIIRFADGTWGRCDDTITLVD